MSTSKRRPEKKAKVSFSTISSFIQGYTRKFSETFGLLDLHKKEQVIWREEVAKECLENGSCVYCGCDTPAKFYSDEGCGDPLRQCYPAMFSAEDWDIWKRQNNITIKID